MMLTVACRMSHLASVSSLQQTTALPAGSSSWDRRELPPHHPAIAPMVLPLLAAYRGGPGARWIRRIPWPRHVSGMHVESTAAPGGASSPKAAKDPKQSFYDFFLKKRIVYQTPEQQTRGWLSSLDPIKSVGALPPTAHANPLSVLEDPATDMDLATRGLAAHVARVNSSAAGKDGLRAQYAETMPGRRALQWYLEAEAYDKFNILLHPRFFDLAAYCLVAEEAESYVWQLWYTKHVPASVTAMGRPGWSWKGLVLRSLVQSRMAWSEDRLALGAGLETVAQALRDGASRKHHPEKYINLGTAGVFVQRYAVKTDPKYLDPRAFDRLIKMTATWQSEGLTHRDYALADLQLRHPSRPGPWPAYRWLSRFEARVNHSPDLRERFLEKGSRGSLGFYMFLILLAQRLGQQGHAEEARHVLDIGKARLPQLFTQHFVHRAAAVDSRPRRYPTAAEVARGARVDDDGLLILE